MRGRGSRGGRGLPNLWVNDRLSSDSGGELVIEEHKGARGGVFLPGLPPGLDDLRLNLLHLATAGAVAVNAKAEAARGMLI